MRQAEKELLCIISKLKQQLAQIQKQYQSLKNREEKRLGKEKAVVIGKIGKRKKIEMVKKAKEMKIEIKNLNIEKFLKKLNKTEGVRK